MLDFPEPAGPSTATITAGLGVIERSPLPFSVTELGINMDSHLIEIKGPVRAQSSYRCLTCAFIMLLAVDAWQ